MPIGLCECIGTILELEDGLAAELLKATPVAVDEVTNVIDIGTNLKGCQATCNVEIELLVNLEVETIQPGADSAVALTILTTMGAEVAVIGDESLVCSTVLVAGERHVSQLFLGGDIDKLSSADTCTLISGHQIGVASLIVASHITHIVAFIEETKLGGGVEAFVDCVAGIGNEPVGGNIVGVAKLMAVVAIGIADLCDVIDLVAYAIGSGHAETVSIGSHQVKTPSEVLAQLCSDRVVLAMKIFGIVE